MQLDKRTLDRLLALDDEQLKHVIRQIARESGISEEQLGLDPTSVQSIRMALGMASEADLERLGEIYRQYLQGRRAH